MNVFKCLNLVFSYQKTSCTYFSNSYNFLCRIEYYLICNFVLPYIEGGKMSLIG